MFLFLSSLMSLLTQNTQQYPYWYWTDANQFPISFIKISFHRYASKNSLVDVESLDSEVRLISKNLYPLNIVLIRPQNCKIGTHNIRNEHVVIGWQRQVYREDSVVTIPNNQIQRVSLKFLAGGGYGKFSGSVSCEASGRIIYTF